MRRQAQRRNPIQMTEFQELVQHNACDCDGMATLHRQPACGHIGERSDAVLRTAMRSGLAVRRLKVIDAVPERPHRSSLRTPLALLAVSLSVIAGVWWWIAQPINLS